MCRDENKHTELSYWGVAKSFASPIVCDIECTRKTDPEEKNVYVFIIQIWIKMGRMMRPSGRAAAA